jgi:hypothetical protein
MKKIGFLVMALVLMLGGLGVGYAAWTDEIIIDGTVNTGSVELTIVEYSGMWFWKVPGGDPEYYFTTCPTNTPEQVPNNPPPFVVGYAASTPGAGEDEITMTFNSLFPLDSTPLVNCDNQTVGSQFAWRANFVIHCEGTIPVKVYCDPVDVQTTDNMTWLYNVGYPNGAWIAFQRLSESYPGYGDPWPYVTGDYIFPGDVIQMHNCQYLLGWMCINIEQMEKTQNLDGTFTFKVSAIQWNEYEAD